MTLGPHIGAVPAQVALPYPTVRSLPPPGEEPYAGSRADLPWKPYLRQLLDRKTITTALVEVLH